MCDQHEASIVRIFTANGAIAGTGFLVFETEVLTCAHVVTQALGQSGITTTEIQLDFPLIQADEKLSARVIVWLERQDIAVLELRDNPPNTARPARLLPVERDLWGHSCWAFGCPTGRDNGVYATGVLRGRQADGWVQIDATDPFNYWLEQGFSGAPVWDEQLDGVVGMAVAAERQPGPRAAYMIPNEVLFKTYRRLQEQPIPPCPYRGLDAFREKDAQFFFGRQTFVDKLVGAVKEKPLVAVVGPSGFGKSSVIFAGLVHRLRREEGWLDADFRPGDRPFNTLAAALVRREEPQMSVGDRQCEVRNLAQELRQEAHGLKDVVSDILRENPGARLLLVVDQLEELYTLCQDANERQCFLDRLLEAVSPESPAGYIKNLTLVFALRADFYDQALSDRRLVNALDNSLNLGPMTGEQLKEAVEEPANKQGVRIQDGLTERILGDVSEEPGDLPLLEFALTQLWAKQNEGRLTHKAYEKIGGVQQALANHAEEVYCKFKKEEKQRVRQVFVQLVSPSAGTKHTRRQATLAQVGKDNWDIVTRLASDRLVVTGRNDASEEEIVELAHEALIKGWKQLSDWVRDHHEFRIWQEELRAAIRRWDRSKDKDALLRGADLVEAEKWLKQHYEDISPGEQDFIKASKKQQNQKFARRRLLKYSIVGTALTTLVALLGIVVVRLWSLEQQNWVIRARNLLSQAEVISKDKEKDSQLQASVAFALEAMNQPDSAEAAAPVLQTTLPLLPRSSVLMKHEGGVNTVAFSQKGTYWATAGFDGKVCVIKTRSPRQECLELKHADSVTAVTFSPDENYLATAGLDGAIRVWKTDSGRLLPELNCGKSATAIAFSPDSKYLAASSDKFACVWHNWKTTNAQPAKLPHHAFVKAIAFSPDSRHLATASLDGAVYLWDPSKNQNQIPKELKGNAAHAHEDGVNAIAFSPDGQRLATAGFDGIVRVWDITSGKETIDPIKHTDRVVDVTFSPDGRRLATASLDGTAGVWDAAGNGEGVKLKQQSGNPVEVMAVAFSPDSKYLATASSDKTARRWDISSSRPVTLMIHEDIVNDVAFSPDGTSIATASLDGTARKWEITRDRPFQPMTHGDSIKAVALSPDGKYLATASKDRTFRIWETNNGKEVKSEKLDKPVTHVAFSPDGKYLATGSDDQIVRVWHDWKTRPKVLTKLPKEGNINSIAFSPNSRYIATATLSGVARVWDLTRPTKLPDRQQHQESVTAVAFSQNGNDLVTASKDNFAKVGRNWKDPSHDSVVWLKHDAFVEDATFSPDGKYVATAGRDSIARIWDLTHLGKPLSASPGKPQFKLDKPLSELKHQGSVTHVAFSPDEGKYLATANSDNTVSVWQDWKTTSPKPLTELKHKGAVTAIRFSKDGEYLATASRGDDLATVNLGGTTCVWEASSGRKTCLQQEKPVEAMDFSGDSKYIAVSSDKVARILLWRREDLHEKACERLTTEITKEQWQQSLGDEPFPKSPTFVERMCSEIGISKG